MNIIVRRGHQDGRNANLNAIRIELPNGDNRTNK